MGVLCIITARGGSKRIPKKNIKEFCGQPIIAYSIKAALESKLFDEVMVSTDSEEIADIARNYGAAVPFMRSSKNADDFAGTEDVVEEVLAEYGKLGRTFESFCCIYPTAPFVTAEKLIEAKKRLHENTEAEGILPVVKFSFPPQRCFVKKEGFVSFFMPEFKDVRSQDLEPLYHDAGQFYFVKMGAFKIQHSVIPIKSLPYVMPELEVQDIDNLSDWQMAELKFQMIENRHKR